VKPIALRQQGIAVTPRTTAAPADATRLAAEALAAGVDLVIVHGGEGTVNEAIQGLVGTPTPLAVWPSGTSNVLARELGLPGSLDLIARMIATGAIRRVSVGRAGERYFLLMAGVGLDADMLRSVHPGLKRLTINWTCVSSTRPSAIGSPATWPPHSAARTSACPA
jgi:diacylglycerol kinase family enzyme